MVFELAKQDLVVSESGVYRALVRLNLIDPSGRRRRDKKWKRWERGTPMELWQMDVVGGFVLADGTQAKALTGVDDHSRYCVSAHLMVRETSRNVCEGLAKALRAHEVLQFYDGDQLLRTEQRTGGGEVRKKRASVPGGRSIVKTSVTNQPN